MKITNPILPKQKNQSNYPYFLKFTQKLNKISCVTFALYAVKLLQNSDQQINNCLNLVEKWLKKPESVTLAELRNAANVYALPGSTNDAAHYVANAAYAAGYNSWTDWTSAVGVYAIIDTNAANAAAIAARNSKNIKIKLLNYLGYLLPKGPELNNFNIDLLKQNQQAYSFLGKISKLKDYEITSDDLFGIRQVFDVLEEVGAPLDPNEFIWNDNIIEKHKLLQTIRREFK